MDCVATALPTDPTQLCAGMALFSQCVREGCRGDEEDDATAVFVLLVDQLEQLACQVETPTCALRCAADADTTPPTSAEAICALLTDTTSCLDGGHRTRTLTLTLNP